MAYVIFYHYQLKLHSDADKSAKSANLGLLCYVSIFKKGFVFPCCNYIVRRVILQSIWISRFGPSPKFCLNIDKFYNFVKHVEPATFFLTLKPFDTGPMESPLPPNTRDQNDTKCYSQTKWKMKLISLIKNWKLFFCVSLRYEMSGKLHLICMKTRSFHAKIRCNSWIHAWQQTADRHDYC